MAAGDEETGTVRREDVLGALLRSIDAGIARSALDTTEPLAPSLAGNALERVILRHTLPSGASWRTRYVVKRLLPERGWLGAATHDMRLREAQLARSGLLDALPHALATPARALRVEGDPAAPTAADLLMDDVTPYLVRHAIGGAAGRLTAGLLALLDRLARLHAHYWCDPRLHDPTLGLVTPRDALLLAAPATLTGRLAAGDDNPYLPLALRGWEAFFALAAPGDAATLEAILRDPTDVLRAVEALPWTLIHGDVWAPNLGWLPRGMHRRPLRMTSRGAVRLGAHAPTPSPAGVTPVVFAFPSPAGVTPVVTASPSPAGVTHLVSASPSPRRERGPGGEDRLLLLDWALAAAAPATYDPLWLCGTTHALDPIAVLAAYRPRLERHLRARGITLAPAVWRALMDAGYLRTALTCGEALGRSAAEAPAGAVRLRAAARVRWWARRAARAARTLCGE